MERSTWWKALGTFALHFRGILPIPFLFVLFIFVSFEHGVGLEYGRKPFRRGWHCAHLHLFTFTPLLCLIIHARRPRPVNEVIEKSRPRIITRVLIQVGHLVLQHERSQHGPLVLSDVALRLSGLELEHTQKAEEGRAELVVFHQSCKHWYGLFKRNCPVIIRLSHYAEAKVEKGLGRGRVDLYFFEHRIHHIFQAVNISNPPLFCTTHKLPPRDDAHRHSVEQVQNYPRTARLQLYVDIIQHFGKAVQFNTRILHDAFWRVHI
mmetsp:Transcript_22982/g.58283  ORF Transcript_22982/g.58283 Transcript_22982/m.58283 type:complete len:264 (+) Transcript_22982:219-1010(+)